MSILTNSTVRLAPARGQISFRRHCISVPTSSQLGSDGRSASSICRLVTPQNSASGIKTVRPESVWRRSPENLVAASAGSYGGGDDIEKDAYGLRRISWISFWLQLALSIVSAIVLFFTATTASRGAFPQAPVFFNLGGVVLGFISTFLSYSRTRIARGVIEASNKVSRSKVAADVLGATRLNLIGLGLTLVGLQSTVGGLVGKALTSSSAGAYNVQSAQNAPAALDVFAVQASTNTILLHFLGIVFANWTLRILNKDAKAASPA